MKNDSPDNSNCDFALDALEYLYGELAGERKKAFRRHLDGCPECAAELQDFSAVRFSIAEWKSSDFDKLATPAIVIPFETATAKTVETPESVSWIAALRNYLSFSRVFTAAAAVFLIALLIGFGIFFSGNREGDNLTAASNAQPDLDVKTPLNPTPSKEETGVQKTNAPDDAADVRKTDRAVEKPQTGEREKPRPVELAVKPAAKSKPAPEKTAGGKTTNIDAQAGKQKAKPAPNRIQRPRLNQLPEDDEDEGLRLTDLFAEIETRE
jgi:hypothetical protein